MLHKVYFDAISHIEAFGDYVKVHTEDSILVTHSTFSKFIENLPDQFLRVHKSFTVNLNNMVSLTGNTINISAHKIPIGQTYKQTVIKHLKL